MLYVLQNGTKVERDLHILLPQLILMITENVLDCVTADCRLEMRSKSPDLYITNCLRIW